MTSTVTNARRTGPRRTAVFAAALALAACGPRGAITIYPDAAAVGQVEDLFVATSRTKDGGPNVWAFGRSDAVGFARFDVSVPPDRLPGTVTFPSAQPPDARTDFVTVAARSIPGEAAFVATLDAELASRPRDKREVIVFTHGFNTNFSEGLYRQAQMTHDFATPGVSVHYSWPSAATIQSYGFDRESAIFARDGLQRTIELIARTRTTGVVVAAHSMGAMVLMEALRSLAISDEQAVFDKLQAVILMAPDLDIELFREQARPLAALGLPIYVFFSSRDRALRLSSLLRGQNARLGSIRDVGEVADLDVTFIDTSSVTEGVDALGHFSVATSPVMISYIRGLDRIGGRIFEDAENSPNAFETTINVVQGVTDVVLQPLAQ